MRNSLNFQIPLTKKERLKQIQDLMLVILGSMILAFAAGIFLVPASINAGGLAGIGIVVDYILNLSFDTVDITVAIVGVVLFFLGWIFLGTPFAIKTALSTVLYPLFLTLFLRVPFFSNLAVRIYLPESTGQIETARILIGGLFGGALTGVGVGLTFIGGGSTGGVDILALLGKRYLKIKESTASFIIDALIIIIGMFVLTDKLLSSLVGVIAALLCAIMIDYVFVGKSSVYVAKIISSKWEEINDFIQNELERGATIYNVEGGYQFAPYRLISVVFDQKEYNEVYRAIAHIDPRAFVIITKAQSVYGEGFSKFTQRKRKDKK
ncbi:MAG: YitT family protein [Bacilli bacterium]